MDINLEIFKKKLFETISEQSKKAIASLYVFGSLARGEKIQEGSDIDSVLVIDSSHFIEVGIMDSLARNLDALDQSLGVTIDHVIVTKDDLLEILSKSLILNLYQDGITIMGADLKKIFSDYLTTCSHPQILNSFLRTSMFRRHLLRKKMLKFPHERPTEVVNDLVRYVAKEVVMVASDYLFFFTDNLITSRRDICSYFMANVSGSNDFINLPMKSYNIRSGIIVLSSEAEKLDFIKESFSFVETISVKLQDKYKQIVKSDVLNLNPF